MSSTLNVMIVSPNYSTSVVGGDRSLTGVPSRTEVTQKKPTSITTTTTLLASTARRKATYIFSAD